VPEARIIVTGNPVIDALQEIVSRPAPAETQALLERLKIHPGPGGKQLVLVTAHRRENFGEPFEGICQALRRLADRFPSRLELVYPVHLNPNVQEPVRRNLAGVANITLLPPLDYLPLVHLLKAATLVLTDSGGIQEEATSLGKPTLVLRNVTERPEGVQAGVLKLVGTDPARIVDESTHLLEDPAAYAGMATAKNPFGDGHAAQKIVQALLHFGEP
jgi:UDP-N-acetylglucosamine 2-epimerase (non-hydrolysing)